MQIRLIKGEDIDKVKWNSCVHYANNGNVFGYKWYLDFVAKEWDALVEGDYESVMPLVYREEADGRMALHQPALIRELGVYSIHVLSPLRVRSFLEAIPAEYARVEMHLNEQNLPPADTGFKSERLTNYQLPLMSEYEVLEQRFDQGLQARIVAGIRAGLRSDSNLKPEAIADFCKLYAPERFGADRVFHGMQRVMYNALHRGWGFASSIQAADGTLLAAGFFITSHNRVLALAAAESPLGARASALDYLYHIIIRTQAGRPQALDFNTMAQSERAEQFGARANDYYRLTRG